MSFKKIKNYVYRLKIIIALIVVMVGVHIINVSAHYALLNFGINPRVITSLPNIIFAPFLHVSWTHLFNNLLGLAIFGSLCLFRSKQFFIYSSAYIIIVGGLLVWLLGRPHVHVGASGWVFGLWSVCIFLALIEKSITNIVIAFFVIAFYGGMIYGLIPNSPRVSYESHLFGVIAGILSLVIKPVFIKKNISKK